MRYFAIRDNTTHEVKIRSVTNTAKLMKVSRMTLYRWEELSKEKLYNGVTISFRVDIPVSLRTIRKCNME